MRTFMKKQLLLCCFTSYCILVANTAFAEPVKIGGLEAFDVPFGVGKTTAHERFLAMQRNIDNALVASSDRTPSAVAIANLNNQPVLTLGGFYIATADTVTAKKMGLTAEGLAARWEIGLKSALRDPVRVEKYIAQLTGHGAVAQTGTTVTDSGSYPYYRQGRIVYIPSGMTMPIIISTVISSECAKVGDAVQASLASPINLGDAQIPANSILTGQVTNAVGSERMAHSGVLGLRFTTLHLSDGTDVPINAHIVGDLGKYHEVADKTDEFHGETTKQKAEDAAIRGAVGAGAGALVGTVIGAIASHGYGTGRGAWSGAALGGALGVADSLLLRKGANVKVESGQRLTLQLDAPAQIALSNL